MTAILIRIGSLILTGLVIFRIIQAIRRQLRAIHPANDQGRNAGPDDFNEPESKEDPYQILGVKHGASLAEIRDGYKRAIQEYHPDKVASMGIDLQEFAKKRTQKIIQAYEQLTSRS